MKRLLSVVASLALAGVMASCDDSSDKKDGGATDAGTSTDAKTDKPDMAQTGGETGATCTDDVDCGGPAPLCLLEADSFPGGYCTNQCDEANNEGEEGYVPVDVIDCAGESGTCAPLDTSISLCLLACSDKSSCRTGYSCGWFFYGESQITQGCISTATTACDPKQNTRDATFKVTNPTCTGSSAPQAYQTACMAFSSDDDWSPFICLESCNPFGEDTCHASNGTATTCRWGLLAYTDTYQNPVAGICETKGTAVLGAACNNTTNACGHGMNCDTLESEGAGATDKCHKVCTAATAATDCPGKTCEDWKWLNTGDGTWHAFETGKGLCTL